MTAIYGYVSKKDKFGVLAADNLESKHNIRVDKISYVGNRYAIAICGSDSISEIIDPISYLSEFEKHDKYNDVESLLKKITDLAKYYSKVTHGVIKEKLTDAEYALLLKNRPELIILDYVEFTIHRAIITIYPPEEIKDELNYVLCRDRRLIPFALANKQSLNIVFNETRITEDPAKYFRELIEKDKSDEPSLIGEVGSMFVFSGGKAFSYSCYSSPLDLMQENFKQLSRFCL